MPVGLQLVGRRFEDEKVGRTARDRTVTDKSPTGPSDHEVHSKQDRPSLQTLCLIMARRTRACLMRLTFPGDTASSFR